MDFPFVKEAVTKLFSKPSCRMYPQVPSEAFPGYRGRIVFHPETCINCNVCERVCAGGAITHTEEKVEEGVKVTRSFDLGSCTFCNTCADFCSRHSIELTTDYHMLGIEEGDLIVSGTFIKAAPKKPAPKPAAAKPAAAPAAKAEAAACEAPAAEAPKPRDDGKPVQDPAKCVYCTICARKCPMEALKVDRAAKTWTLDEEKCVGCGTCRDVCPKNAIIM
jgi:formate hydrogenlyase subunit 6/NADH:ubiquinone oxidoreductase subunit I